MLELKSTLDGGYPSDGREFLAWDLQRKRATAFAYEAWKASRPFDTLYSQRCLHYEDIAWVALQE